MVDRDDPEEIEIRVIQDVIDTIEQRLRRHERLGGQVLTSRSRIYAVVVQAVVSSARERSFGATLDSAAVLDYLLDGADYEGPQDPVDAVIGRYLAGSN